MHNIFTLKRTLEIIHGDIKPENILIFKDDAGAYTARITDFGYSTRFANEDDVILMPKSRPWDAPDRHYNCKPAQAQKMDAFSFGMLCLWVMFERYLSAIAPLPQEALWAEQYFQNKGEEHLSKRVLEDLKHEDKLVLLARQLVTAEQDIDDDKKQALQQFFSVSLVCEPDLREADLKRSFGCLIPDQ
jgi:serine/threonine protein kinase